MFTIACRIGVGLGLGLGLGLDLVSHWLVLYAHVFVLLSTVIVTLPQCPADISESSEQTAAGQASFGGQPS